MAGKKLCFVIAPIGDEESETRKRSDQILKYVIAPAVASFGYEAVRADQISEPGIIITSQVIQHVVNDPLVVADLTDSNPNVFYELALRHASKKPLIQIIQTGESLPFDVIGTRTIFIDYRNLESVARAKQEIENQVRAIEEKSFEIDTPISVALELPALKQSDNPEKVFAALNEMRSSLSAIEKRLEADQKNEGFLNTSTVTELSQTQPVVPTKRQIELITGKWSGPVDQKRGKIINFEINLKLTILGSEIHGNGGFFWDGKEILIRITRGWISHGDFVRLDYEDVDSAKIFRYGSMLFELVPTQRVTKLNGWFVGFAPEAQTIIAGSIILSKIA